jgi:hypothetical protein
MSSWEALPFVLLGILVVLLPVGVIGLVSSKLMPGERSGILVIYGGIVFLLAVIASDILGWLPGRILTDLVVLVGGLFIGGYAGRLLTLRIQRRT